VATALQNRPIAVDGDLGGIVREARRRSGISQTELAIRAGTSQAAISQIESGGRVPSYERFVELLTALGWRPEMELVPLAEPDSDLRQLSAEARLTPSERLERGAAWSRLATSIHPESDGNGRG
jgi:transcriptional regulator with XRE-family HTH domain